MRKHRKLALLALITPVRCHEHALRGHEEGFDPYVLDRCTVLDFSPAAFRSATMAETPAMPDLKKQIRELKSAISEATSAKRRADVKKMRRRKKRLKARTRKLARASKAAGTAAPATPAA